MPDAQQETNQKVILIGKAWMNSPSYKLLCSMQATWQQGELMSSGYSAYRVSST